MMQGGYGHGGQHHGHGQHAGAGGGSEQHYEAEQHEEEEIELEPILRKDEYGFELEFNYPEQSRKFDQVQEQEQTFSELRNKSWNEEFGDAPIDVDNLDTFSSNFAMLVSLGIPHEKRKILWPKFLLGVSKKKGVYFCANSKEPASNSLSELYAIRDIEQDIERTFPNHHLYQTDEGKEQLKRSLIAFARRVPSIGYCQSLNFICALLLLVLEDEQVAVEMLVTIAEDCFPGYYTQTMLGYQTDQRVLEELIEVKLPEISQHFKKQHFVISTVSIRWFLCLMINTLSTEALLTVWDNLFYMGSVGLLFSVILAILKMNETEILEAPTAADIVGVLQSPAFGLVYSAELMEVVEKIIGVIPDDDIIIARENHQIEIEKEMAEAHKRREILELQKRTKFTKNELLQLQEEFEQLTQSSKSKCISFEGFEDVFTRVIPHWHKGDVFLKRIFSIFDLHGDSCLNFQELMCGFSILCKGTLDEKLKLIFEVYDVGHKGYLELQELTTIFEHVYNRFYTAKAVDITFVQDAFNTMDSDRDGRLSLEEFKQIAVIQPLVLECFARPAAATRRLQETKASTTIRASFHITHRPNSPHSKSPEGLSLAIARKAFLNSDMAPSPTRPPNPPTSIYGKQPKKQPAQPPDTNTGSTIQSSGAITSPSLISILILSVLAVLFRLFERLNFFKEKR